MVTIVRDTLWNNIRLDEATLRLVDSGAFQRLRYVRQLGHAHLVYPGATHTRFEHALGTFHLTGQTFRLLEEQGELSPGARDDQGLVRAAALLHDIGHYPFSHALEEIGAPHHEDVAATLLRHGELAEALTSSLGVGTPDRILALIRGESASPLQGLISGSLDLDKIEYLKRDALMCGVPYGEIDVDRLLNSLVVVTDPGTARPGIGLREKGLSALESLLFAKYQMYRNVYWHHAVRSGTAMYKRLVHDALAAGAIRTEALASFTDEGLLFTLERGEPRPLLTALRQRRLFKRAFETPAASLSDGAAEWIAEDRGLAVAAEDALARIVGLEPGELLLDFPAKTQMLGLDLPVQLRGGRVERLTSTGLDGTINLPTLSHQLYQSARWLRIFTARPITLDVATLKAWVVCSSGEIRERLERG
ncbi:MAG: hypothetical protein NVS1B4_18630 [Gemmatimonadaceae bacterium]